MWINNRVYERLLLFAGILFQFSTIHAGGTTTGGGGWQDWWTYDGISGPDFWGLVNPNWRICNKGKLQSPINIDPKRLLFDPNLTNIRMDKQWVSGVIFNTGHDVTIFLEQRRLLHNDDDDDNNNNVKNGIVDDDNNNNNNHHHHNDGEGSNHRNNNNNRNNDNDHRQRYKWDHPVNITGGPLVYNYRIAEIKIHFGSIDTIGSEHTVDGSPFPAEIQIVAYNAELYSNFSEAAERVHGLAVLSLFVQISETSNQEFDVISKKLSQIRYKGENSSIARLSPHRLLPDTHNYITYEGSLTSPGCQEAVTWILMNNPIYISTSQMAALRQLMQGTKELPKIPMENNNRPTMPINNRPVRTNINFPKQGRGCPTMEKAMFYRANSLWTES